MQRVLCSVMVLFCASALAQSSGEVDGGAPEAAAPMESSPAPDVASPTDLSPPPLPPTAPTAPAAAAPAEEAPTTPEQPELVITERSVLRIEYKTGGVVRGVLLSQTPEALTLKLPNGRTHIVKVETIKTVTEDHTLHVSSGGDLWGADANRTRYFYGPTAMMLRQGEVGISQKQLLITSVAVGATDWLSLQVGAVLPLWLIPNGFNIIGAVKVGWQVGDDMHLAAGTQLIALPFGVLGVTGAREPIAGGFLFGTVTYGSPDAHASFTAGVPLFTGLPQVVSGEAIVTVSGNYRVHDKLALVSENWMLTQAQLGGVWILTMQGIRVIDKGLSVDIGALWAINSQQGVANPNGIPIPWLDLTYNF